MAPRLLYNTGPLSANATWGRTAELPRKYEWAPTLPSLRDQPPTFHERTLPRSAHYDLARTYSLHHHGTSRHTKLLGPVWSTTRDGELCEPGRYFRMPKYSVGYQTRVAFGSQQVKATSLPVERNFMYHFRGRPAKGVNPAYGRRCKTAAARVDPIDHFRYQRWLSDTHKGVLGATRGRIPKPDQTPRGGPGNHFETVPTDFVRRKFAGPVIGTTKRPCTSTRLEVHKMQVTPGHIYDPRQLTRYGDGHIGQRFHCRQNVAGYTAAAHKAYINQIAF